MFLVQQSGLAVANQGSTYRNSNAEILLLRDPWLQMFAGAEVQEQTGADDFRQRFWHPSCVDPQLHGVLQENENIEVGFCALAG